MEAAVRELIQLQQREAATAEGGNTKSLRTDYLSLVKKYPKSVPVRDACGAFLWAHGDRDLALHHWEEAEDLEPRNPLVLERLAAAHLELGKPRPALAFYLRATQAVPEDARWHFSVANIAYLFRHDVGLTEQQCFDLALKHFGEAHRLAPANQDYARGYAELFYLLPSPDWQQAVAAWEGYLKLASDKNFALINLTRVYMKMGEAAKARACLEQVTGEANERLKKRLSERIEAELSGGERSETADGRKNLETSH